MREPPPEQTADPRDVRVLDGLRTPAVLLDRRAPVVHANQAALDFFGTTRDRLTGADGVEELFGPAEQGPADEVLTKVLGGDALGRRAARLRARRARRAHAPVRHRPVPRRTRSTASSSSRRTRAARAAGPSGWPSGSPGWPGSPPSCSVPTTCPRVTKIVIEHMADAAGATVASLSVLGGRGPTLRLVGLAGRRAAGRPGWETYPCGHAGRGQRRCRVGRSCSAAATRSSRRYPDLETATDGERSLVCLPLIVGDRTLGVATMSFPGRRDVRHRRAGVLPRHVRHLRAGPGPGAGTRRRRRPGRQARPSWPRPPTSWPAASTTSRPCATWRGSPSPGSRTGARSRSASTGSCARSRSRTSTRTRSRWPRSSSERYPPDPDAPRGSYQVLPHRLRASSPRRSPTRCSTSWSTGPGAAPA